MSGPGDMVTVLSLDDYEYMTGLRSAAAETKKFGHDAAESASMMESFHKPIHKATHLAAGFAFAVGEGKDNTAHTLEHLAMMAPLIGSTIGEMATAGTMLATWAPPLGIAAAILGSAIIPGMLETEEATKRIGDAIAHNSSLWDRFAAKVNSGEVFGRGLGAINKSTDPQKILDQKFAIEDAKAGMEAELKARKSQQRQQLEAANKAIGEAKQRAGQDSLEELTRAAIERANDQGLSDEEYLAKHANDTIDKGILGEKGTEAIVKTEEQIKDLEDSIARAERRAEALGEKLHEAVENQLGDDKALQDLDKERDAMAKKIAADAASPYDKALAKAQELQDALERGWIDQDLFDKANEKNLKELGAAEKAAMGNQKNKAVESGTAAAYEAIRESIRSTEKNDSPGVAELRTLVDLNRQQLKAQQDIAKKQDVEGVNIPG